jgi:hypothetical protein
MIQGRFKSIFAALFTDGCALPLPAPLIPDNHKTLTVC